MGFDISDVRFTPYGPGRLPAPFGQRGYLFTIPGNYPDLSDYFRTLDWQLAVYRTRASGAEMWEVRDTERDHRVWGEDTTRRGAVGLALAELARARRLRAAEIRDHRVTACGLAPEPPYRVETVGSASLVLTPGGVGRLTRVEVNNPGHAAAYWYTDLETGREHTAAADGPVTLHNVMVGLLHSSCTCPAPGLARFHETREDAVADLTENYNAWWQCTGRPA